MNAQRRTRKPNSKDLPKRFKGFQPNTIFTHISFSKIYTVNLLGTLSRIWMVAISYFFRSFSLHSYQGPQYHTPRTDPTCTN